MLPTRSLLFAASSESGSILFVVLSLFGTNLPLTFCEPFRPLPGLAAPFCAELAAELDADTPDTYRWNLAERLLLAATFSLLPAKAPGLPLSEVGLLAARDL